MLMNFQQDTEIVETFIHMLSSYLHTELIFADTVQNANSGRVLLKVSNKGFFKCILFTDVCTKRKQG
jgi:hypothetical protein